MLQRDVSPLLSERVRVLLFALLPVIASSCGPRAPGTASADRDADGVADSADLCPDDPEDLDAYQDEDGCPDCDTDIEWMHCTGGDAEACPGATHLDHDADGIGNETDACPSLPEDRDGYEDDDGCPEPDNDSDCLDDSKDRCPNEPGPASSVGCPAPGA